MLVVPSSSKMVSLVFQQDVQAHIRLFMTFRLFFGPLPFVALASLAGWCFSVNTATMTGVLVCYCRGVYAVGGLFDALVCGGVWRGVIHYCEVLIGPGLDICCLFALAPGVRKRRAVWNWVAKGLDFERVREIGGLQLMSGTSSRSQNLRSDRFVGTCCPCHCRFLISSLPSFRYAPSYL